VLTPGRQPYPAKAEATTVCLGSLPRSQEANNAVDRIGTIRYGVMNIGQPHQNGLWNTNGGNMDVILIIIILLLLFGGGFGYRRWGYGGGIGIGGILLIVLIVYLLLGHRL
jgi:hypothetical protein